MEDDPLGWPHATPQDGGDRLWIGLGGDDFDHFHRCLAKTRGRVAPGNAINRARILFKWVSTVGSIIGIMDTALHDKNASVVVEAIHTLLVCGTCARTRQLPLPARGAAIFP